MFAAISIFCLFALLFCALTYVLEATGRAIVFAPILVLMIGKIVLGLLSVPCVAIWYLVDSKSCKAAMDRDMANRAARR